MSPTERMLSRAVLDALVVQATSPPAADLAVLPPSFDELLDELPPYCGRRGCGSLATD
jgi:hypothetical protein